MQQSIAALISLCFVTLGSGLFTTLVSVRLHHEGYASLTAGVMAAALYLGLAVGSFRVEKFIIRVGHIRAFAAFSAILTAAYLMQGMIFNMLAWALLRVIQGVSTAGVFVVIESWLLVSNGTESRGKVLAIYMVVLYASQATGQLMLELAEPESLELFAIAALFTSLSIVPLAYTKLPAPEIEEPSTLNFIKLIKRSRSGVLACFCSGLIMGATFGLLPLYLAQQLHQDNISFLMASVIFGGMFLQYPIGRLSDMFDRRVILIASSLLTAIVSTIICFSTEYGYLLLSLLFIFGGLTFCIYPIGISLAADTLTAKDITAGTQTLLLFYSIGAMLGPLMAPACMKSLGSIGLFVFFIIVSAVLALFLSWRRFNTDYIPSEENFSAMPQTTPVISEIDPRGD